MFRMELLKTFGLAVALTFSNASCFALTAEQVYQRNQNSMVTIYSSAKGESQGSGVVVEVNARQALVTTNCHVVEGAATVSILALGRRMLGDVLTCDKRADIALVAVSIAGLKPALMHDGPLPVGAVVYAIGTPRGLEKSISQGIVSQIRATPNGDRLQTTAPIAPGSSGGGLFDAQGRLIGITTSQISGSQALNFAIPLSEVLLHVRQLGAAQQPKRQGIRGNLNIKEFALGLHCTEVRDAIRRLEDEGLLPPKNLQQFCAASNLEGQSVWAGFFKEEGKTERKAMFTVSTDDQGFIESVHYQDVWFHNASQPPPDVGTLLAAVQRKYGPAPVVMQLESRSPAFFGPALDSKVQVHVYTADPMSKDLLVRLQRGNSSSAFEALMREHPGEYVIVEVSENSRVTGEPVSVSLEMSLNKGSKPAAANKDLRL